MVWIKKILYAVAIYTIVALTMGLIGNVTLLYVKGYTTGFNVPKMLTLPAIWLTHPLDPSAAFAPYSEMLAGALWLEIILFIIGFTLYILIRHNVIDLYRILGKNELDKPLDKRLKPSLSAVGIWDSGDTSTVGEKISQTLGNLLPGKQPAKRSNGMLVPLNGTQPGDRILLGTYKHLHFIKSKKYNVYARPEHHVAVYGPSGTGKGASQMNPSLLFWNGPTENSPDGFGVGWPGPLITSTVKNDHVDVALEWRQALSDQCFVYDPLALYPEYKHMWCGWDPLTEIKSFNDASKVAQALMDSEQQQASSKSGTDDYFQAQALMVLGPLLLSAAVGKEEFSKVFEWCLGLEAEGTNPDAVAEDGTVNPESLMYEVMNNLYDYAEEVGDETPINQLQQVFTKAPQEASGVWGSIRKSLQPYNDEVSVKSTSSSTMPRMFNPRKFYTTPNATLFIIAPEVASEAKRMRPVFAAFLSWLIEQAQMLARENNGRLPMSVLANLDEVKNVGAIPGLAHTLSLTRSARFFVKHAWQDDAQIESAYGKDDAKTIVSNSRTWVVLPGVSDVTHLDTLAKLIGEKHVRKVSKSRKGVSMNTESSSHSQERMAAANAAGVKELKDNKILVFSDNMTPFVVDQARYYMDPVMLERFKMGDERRENNKK